jgi:hypothetical protein
MLQELAGLELLTGRLSTENAAPGGRIQASASHFYKEGRIE